MSNTIPPFLCNTPPPIDFDEINETEDDFGTFESNDPEYGTFSVGSLEKSHTLELPLPQETNLPLFLNQGASANLKDNQKDKSINESVNEEISESGCKINSSTTDSIATENDQSNRIFDEYLKDNDYEIETEIITNEITENLENLTVDSSPQKTRDDSPQSIEFGNGHSSEDDCSIGDFQTADIVKYDDNTSLPSLKFDPVENLKSEDNSIQKHQDLDNKTRSLEDTLNFSAFQTENTEEFYNNTNQNTETFKLQYAEHENVSESSIEIENYQSETNITENSNAFVNNSNYNDDEDDEFDAFETFTCDRTVEINVQETAKDPIDMNNTFEADFSQFEFECNDTSVVETNSILNVGETERLSMIEESNEESVNQIENVKEEIADDDDDDDFGEFNEFSNFKDETLTKTEIEEITSPANVQDKLKSVIGMMFPIENTVDGNCQRDENLDKLHTNLEEIDSAKALDYQWVQSNVKHSLIKALGIDSRNILYGEKWNTNMPRFAANLGFNPLEPLKPIKLTNNRTPENVTENKMKSKTDVPAVEFDWNSSGLVNPLDGIKEILQERKMDTIHTTESNSDYQSIEIEQQQQQQQTNEASTGNNQTPTNTSTFVSDINNDITIAPSNIKETSTVIKTESSLANVNQLKEGSQQSQQKILSTSSYSLPLKETHIFSTDSKPKSTLVSKELQNDEDKCSIDFDYKMAAAGIIINENVVKKEYRDIEYNPIKLKLNLDDQKDQMVHDNDEQFQKTSHQTEYYNNECDLKIIKNNNGEKIEEENQQKSQIDSSELFNLPISSSQQFIGNNSFCDFKTNVFEKNISSSINSNEQISTIDSDQIIHNEQITQNSNLELSTVKDIEEIEDEFTEFQHASPPSTSQQPTSNTIVDRHQLKSNNKSSSVQNETSRASNLVDEMILSPAVLLPQTVDIGKHKPEINWPEPGINPEELKRLEKMFPQAKSSPQMNPSANMSLVNNDRISGNSDDDDWSDFVSVQAPTNIKPSPIHSGTCQQATMNSLQCGDDEWSDFVYSVPPPSQSQFPSISSSVACVSDSFSGLMNTNSLAISNLSTNQFMQTTTTTPISQYYPGANLIQQQQLLNGFSMPIQLSNKQFYQEASHQNFPCEQVCNNALIHQKHQQQAQFNRNRSARNSSALLMPDLTFITPKNPINSSAKSNIPKK